MQLYQFVWLILLSYMGYKGIRSRRSSFAGVLSVLGKGSFFGGTYDSSYDDFGNLSWCRGCLITV